MFLLPIVCLSLALLLSCAPKCATSIDSMIPDQVQFNNALTACELSYITPANYGLLESIGVDTSKFHDAFSATLIMGTDGKYYLAFEGSTGIFDIFDRRWWGDWMDNNIPESVLKCRASQFEQAIELASYVANWLATTSASNGDTMCRSRVYFNDVILTGHSLGGGLAMAAGMATGLNVIGFDSEGVNSYYNGGEGCFSFGSLGYINLLPLINNFLPAPGHGIAQNPHSVNYVIDADELTYLMNHSCQIIAQLPNTSFNKKVVLPHNGVYKLGHDIHQFDTHRR